MLGEVLMIDKNRELRTVGFFDRWARSSKAISVAFSVAILAGVGVSVATGSAGAAAGSVVCLILVLADLPWQARRIEDARRGREILNRYSSERNARPLGL
jgi:hypothetical protein